MVNAGAGYTPGMDAVEELRAVAREVVDVNAGKVRTHRVGCWKWHAGCLAELILEVTSDAHATRLGREGFSEFVDGEVVEELPQ